MKNILFYFIALVTVFSTSCGAETENNGLLGNGDGDCFEYNACNPGFVCEDNICVDALKLTKDTIIITKEESENVLIETGENKLVFLKNNRTSLFKKNYILAFEETEVFENGFIGFIKSVEFDNDNDKVIVITEEVSPFEILGDFKLDIDENIVFDQPIDPNYANLDRNITKDIAYDKSFYSDALKLSGNMSVKYNFKMHIDVRRSGSVSYPTYTLNKFTNTHNVEITNDLTAKFNEISYTNKNLKMPYSGSDLLSKQKIASFTVQLPYGIKTKGEVFLSVRAQYAGLLYGNTDIKLKTKSTIKSELKYENNRATRINDFNSEKLSLDEDVKINGNLTVSFKVTPEVSFKAYSSSVTNNLVIGTEIRDTSLLLKSSVDASSGNSKACYSIKGVGSSNVYANLDMMKIYRNGRLASNGIALRWNKKESPPIKNFNWLGSEKECKDFKCDENIDCRVSQETISDSCNGGSCSTDGTSTEYEFVEISEGDFIRGCVEGDENCLNDETPATTVHLTAYKIGKKEVTVAQYKACVNTEACVELHSGNYVESDRDNHPVNSLSWLDAQRYCAWIGRNDSENDVRLPTEAEWEYAAKGGNNSLYPWGDAEPTCDVTVKESEEGVDGCGENTTAEVGSKSGDSSGYGVLDMGGNVSEFTNDYYDGAYYHQADSLLNPKGPVAQTTTDTYISVHGGNWMTHKDTSFRNSSRLKLETDTKSTTVGFRCAKKVKTTEEEGEGTVDNPIELGTLTPGYKYDDERDTNDATSKFFDTYPANGTAEYGKEFIYHFKIEEKLRIKLNVATPEPSGTDIDLHLFRTLSAASPGLVKRDDKAIDVVIEPGDYYISMDSYGRSGSSKEGKYKLHIEIEGDSPATGDCANVTLIELNTTTLPYHKVDTKDTKTAPNDCFNTYKPQPNKEFGKEFIYHFKITKKVSASFSIKTPEPNGVDIDLHLFKALDSDAPDLIKRDNESISENLEPGDYYLSLDSWGAEGEAKEGSYELTIDLKEWVPVSNEGWFNEYMLKAVTYTASHHAGGGYDLHKRYTHKLKYGTSEYLSYYSGGTKTMCSAAVTEIVITAMHIYADETGDNSVFTKFTRSQWDNKFIAWQFPFSTSGSKGFGDAVNHFNMGKRVAFKDLLPGGALNYNRVRAAGHTVIFLGFLDKQGNIYDSYPTGKTIIGFKFYSAQGTTGGMGYKLAIWSAYRTWAISNFCNKASLTKGVSCDTWKGIIQTGTYGPNSGMLYMPAKWNPSF